MKNILRIVPPGLDLFHPRNQDTSLGTLSLSRVIQCYVIGIAVTV